MFKSRRAVPVSDATCPAGGGETQKQTNIKHGNKRVRVTRLRINGRVSFLFVFFLAEAFDALVL